MELTNSLGEGVKRGNARYGTMKNAALGCDDCGANPGTTDAKIYVIDGKKVSLCSGCAKVRGLK